MPLHLSWPSRCLPVVTTGGLFPMRPQQCNGYAYVHPGIALHLHEYRGTIVIRGKRFRLRPGDLTFSPPGPSSSTYQLEEEGNHLCVHFRPETGLADGAALKLPLHLSLGPLAAAARERFWRLIDYHRQANGDPRSPAGSAASATLQELLVWIHLQHRSGARQQRAGGAEEALAKLRQVIDASLRKQVSVPDLAAQTELSADYLSRLFRRRYGMSIPHYLLQRRMEQARHLLLASGAPILEVGRLVGIPDPQYFNKQFRRVTGRSPSQYRLEHRLTPASERKAKKARSPGNR